MLSKKYSGTPKSKQTAASPKPTCNAEIPKTVKNDCSGVKMAISNPTIIALNSVGGIAARKGAAALRLDFEINLIINAESKVAIVPKTISIGPKGLARLESKQPSVNPGIAAGVNSARIFSASEILN